MNVNQLRKKELVDKIRNGEYSFFPEYIALSYEESKESLVDINEKSFKRNQGASRLLRDLKNLTTKSASR